MSNNYLSKLIKSLFRSFRQALFENEELQKLGKKYPKTIDFIKNRFDRTKFRGLPLTICVIAFLYVLALLAGAVEDFITSDIIVSADIRVSALFYSLRNLSAIKFFLWITILGNSLTIIIFGLVVSGFLWLSRQKLTIITLCLTVVGSETFTFLSKTIFHRPRPIRAVLLESSASFPSGHATIAVAFYGFLIYLALRSIKKKRYRWLVLGLGTLLIAAIGFSRLYLGVHYVSDVWTGYLVGLMWLIIGISITEWRLFNSRRTMAWGKPSYKEIKIGLVIFTIIFYVAYGLFYRPQLKLKISDNTIRVVNNSSIIFFQFDLPHYTETIVGKPQEPISLVIIAPDDAALITDFAEAGWSLADDVNWQSTSRLFKSAALNKNYSTAPMTPSFWNQQVHDFGFEKSTESKSVRQRHHARFWKTNLKTMRGDSIYVGTVSLDAGIKWFITHKISPDIDTERELVFADLYAAGVLDSFEKFQAVRPVLGKNFSGDEFFTDGEAYHIILKSAP